MRRDAEYELREEVMSISPIEETAGGLRLKRDDLLTAFGSSGPNGDKLLQAWAIVNNAAKARSGFATGVITACSVHSPQSAIAAAVAWAYDLPCTIYFGTSSDSALKHVMPRVARAFGAEFEQLACARHNYMQLKLSEIAANTGKVLIRYGMGGDLGPQHFIVARQTDNLPRDIDTLAVTCGSATTLTGIMLGIAQRKLRHIRRVIALGTAPNRRSQLNAAKAAIACETDWRDIYGLEIEYHDMHSEKGFVYEKGLQGVRVGEAALHPQYEAKAWAKLQQLKDWDPARTLFWIVGKEIKEADRYGIFDSDRD